MNYIEQVESVLCRNGSDREMNELDALLRRYDYVKAEKPTVAAKPENADMFASRVDTAIRVKHHPFHDAVMYVLKRAGYSIPRPMEKHMLLLNLGRLPVALQDIFKVFTDRMLCGLQDRQKALETADPRVEWDNPHFTGEVAVDQVVRNLLKGDHTDAANFLMFMSARGFRASPAEIRTSLQKVVTGSEIPAVRPGVKTPNKGFHIQTHGREVPNGYISGLKDELAEDRLHWIRAVPGYDELFNILALAYDQAARGKGKERHANNLPFDQQPLMHLADKFGTGFLLGQAAKKLEESTGLPYGADVKELLGSIVYTCAAVMHLEKEMEKESDDLEGPF